MHMLVFVIKYTLQKNNYNSGLSTEKLFMNTWMLSPEFSGVDAVQWVYAEIAEDEMLPSSGQSLER